MPTREQRIDYIEFPMTDLPAAKAFYSAVFGWEFVDYGPEYASFTQESAGVAGGFFLAPDAPAAGMPLVVIHVDDLAAAEAAVVAAGGSITKPTFSFPGGSRFHFTDPSGNELSIWHDDEAQAEIDPDAVTDAQSGPSYDILTSEDDEEL